MPIGEYKDFADCVAKNQDKDNPEAYCGKIKHQVEDSKSEGKLEIKDSKDPRGDGPVLDDRGQPNIIDYSNQEPLLFGLGDNSSHEYPGKIVITNESRYVDREVKRSYIPNVAATGRDATGADKTQPTLPTGAPYELQKPSHNMHGMNFNTPIDWSKQEVVSIGKGLVARQIGGTKDCKKEGGPGSGRLKSLAGKISAQAPMVASTLVNLATQIPLEGVDQEERKEMVEALLKGEIKNLTEAAFIEGDHPREPAGTAQGGEFVSSDKPPTGSEKEDKEARVEFFKDTNTDNMTIEKLNGDIFSKTLDRNIANVKDQPTADLNEEISLLKIKQDRLVSELKGKNRLEGVQAQRTLLSIQDAKAEVAKSKEGSKKRENAMMDVMANEFRLDRIRKGVHADFDLTGKPTNQAGFEQQQEEKRIEELLSKKPIKTTMKDLASFKDAPNMKLGNKVDKRHVKQVEKIWNNLEPSDRRLVDNIMIRATRKGGAITAGEWKENNTMEITTHPLFSEKDYEETIHHELAHAKFRNYDVGKVERWNEAVKDLEPPTRYAQYHEKRHSDYMFNNIRVRPDDRPIVERNLKALKNLYFEEIHSEVYANLKSPLPEKKIWSKEGLEQATKIYQEMFT